ncbi:MAG: FAD-dependent oxidoreductase [Micrococcaceae bacterium]
MRIAIIGAGIGGLVTAVGLQRDGHDVTVFEKRQEPNPGGAGLTLFGNSFSALDLIGLGDIVRGISSDAITSLRTGQRTPSGSWLLKVPSKYVSSMRTVHRVELHRVLQEQLNSGTLRTGKTALVASDGKPEMVIDGHDEDFDLIVAADGINSQNRAQLGLDTGLHYSGFTAWRGVISKKVELSGQAGETLGAGKIFGLVPLPHNRVYWYATLNTPADTVFPDELQKLQQEFSDWHEPVSECIAATEAEEILHHDIYDLNKVLPSFVRGRTVLLGDAAHAMVPNLGQGAGQAIEDAATLVYLLRYATEKNFDALLNEYTNIRQKRTKAIFDRSRMVSRFVQVANPLAVEVRNASLRLTPGSIVGKMTQGIQAWPNPEDIARVQEEIWGSKLT